MRVPSAEWKPIALIRSLTKLLDFDSSPDVFESVANAIQIRSILDIRLSIVRYLNVIEGRDNIEQ